VRVRSRETSLNNVGVIPSLAPSSRSRSRSSQALIPDITQTEGSTFDQSQGTGTTQIVRVKQIAINTFAGGGSANPFGEPPQPRRFGDEFGGGFIPALFLGGFDTQNLSIGNIKSGAPGTSPLPSFTNLVFNRRGKRVRSDVTGIRNRPVYRGFSLSGFAGGRSRVIRIRRIR